MLYNYEGKSRQGGIYKIINITNERIYIGKAARFKERWTKHVSRLRSNRHENSFLQNDWNKWGEDAFEFHILEIINGPTNDRNKAEEKWLEQYHDNQTKCYNFKKKSDSLPRRIFSNDPDITKKILSEKSKAMWANPKTRKKILKQKNAAMKMPEYKEAPKEGLQKAWANEERRDKTSKRLKEEHASGSRKRSIEVLKANQKIGRVTFKERMKTDSDFMKKYQEIGRQNIAKRNAEQPKKKYPPLISPDGKVYEVCGVPTFCKEHGLTKQLLYGVLNGKSKSHMGWRLAD